MCLPYFTVFIGLAPTTMARAPKHPPEQKTWIHGLLLAGPLQELFHLYAGAGYTAYSYIFFLLLFFSSSISFIVLIFIADSAQWPLRRLFVLMPFLLFFSKFNLADYGAALCNCFRSFFMDCGQLCESQMSSRGLLAVSATNQRKKCPFLLLPHFHL